MSIRVLLWFGMGVLFITVGCASEDSKKERADTATIAAAWLERTPTPQSDFAPANFEAIIDSIVSRLNEQPQQVGMPLSFVPKTLLGFAEMAVLGANRAHAELGALGTVLAPPTEDDTDGTTREEIQVDILNSQVAAGKVGIGIAPFGTTLSPAIDAAVDAGTTVITFDGDLPDSKRQLYLGTINLEAGKTGGETMVRYLGAKMGTVVILGTTDETWVGGYERTEAAKYVLKHAGYTVIVSHTNWGDRQENVDFIQNVYETADPPAVGCLGLFSTAFLCADAAVAAGKEADITIVAFDAEPQTMEYMTQGIIQATHVQRAYYMGYLLPYLLYAANTIGLEETKALVAPLMVDDSRINTGLDVIPRENIAAYDAFIASLAAL